MQNVDFSGETNTFSFNTLKYNIIKKQLYNVSCVVPIYMFNQFAKVSTLYHGIADKISAKPLSAEKLSAKRL